MAVIKYKFIRIYLIKSTDVQVNTLIPRYYQTNSKDLNIEIEVRNIPELKKVLNIGGVYRILIDNFDTPTLKDAVALVKEYNASNDIKICTEASGGTNETNIREYALTKSWRRNVMCHQYMWISDIWYGYRK